MGGVGGDWVGGLEGWCQLVIILLELLVVGTLQRC